MYICIPDISYPIRSTVFILVKLPFIMAANATPSPTESDSSATNEQAEGVREYLQERTTKGSSEFLQGQDVQHGGLFGVSHVIRPCEYCTRPTKSRWCDDCHLWWHVNIECPPPVRLRSYSIEVRQGPQGTVPACWACVRSGWLMTGARTRSSRLTLR